MTFTAKNINVVAGGEYYIHDNGGTSSNTANTLAADPVAVATLEQLVWKLTLLKKPTRKKQSTVWKYIYSLSNTDIRRLKMINSIQATHYCFYCKELLDLSWHGNEKGRRGSVNCY